MKEPLPTLFAAHLSLAPAFLDAMKTLATLAHATDVAETSASHLVQMTEDAFPYGK